jgi:hypothetical protein
MAWCLVKHRDNFDFTFLTECLLVLLVTLKIVRTFFPILWNVVMKKATGGHFECFSCYERDMSLSNLSFSAHIWHVEL